MKYPADASYRWRPHPWHGLTVGPDVPRTVHGFIEICPSDLVKYEIDKETGYLRIDRPQRSSAQQPTLYGFVPRTYCGDRVRDLMDGASCGDGDPLDICVITERPVEKSEILVNAKVVGGLPMLDGGEADDKIIAILEKDPVFGHIDDIKDLPQSLVERIAHYFLTYKFEPGKENKVSIGDAYGFEHASKVIAASIEDYNDKFGSNHEE